jgi:hypothetical protein
MTHPTQAKTRAEEIREEMLAAASLSFPPSHLHSDVVVDRHLRASQREITNPILTRVLSMGQRILGRFSRDKNRKFAI